MGNRYIVYLHINKDNNKVYVGITKHLDPKLRWKNGKGYTKCIKFYKAITKYGWNKFSHIVLCKTSQQQAEVLEATLIRYYKRHNRSYNITDGGERNIPSMLGKHHTPEAIEKIRAAGRRPCSDETKQKISKANLGAKNGMYGKTISRIALEKIKKKFSKPVLQYSLQGDFIAEFPSTMEAERFINKRGSHISCCCREARKTAYGYIWKYKI